MFATWGEAEYSHGILIPFIALYLFAVRLGPLVALDTGPAWLGVGVVGLALVISVFGELSAIYVIVQYAMVFTIWAVVLTLIGIRGVKCVWGSLVFLLFMVPLPRFIQWNLSDQLQLISSGMGTAMLRAAGIPVFLEGNVIDLGNYKLQVVEACAGLRYLFPLMSFGLLCALLLKGAVWQRLLLFVSSVPIAIVMNSFRIAVTGVLVNIYGAEAADGFLHYFEGWVIFSICLVILFLVMWVLARLSGQTLDDILQLEVPSQIQLRAASKYLQISRPLVAATALMVFVAFAVGAIDDRAEQTPNREALASFPLAIGQWVGQELELGEPELEVLQLTDYIRATYASSESEQPVELYAAYYGSQRKGASIHSPRACLPGGGWVIDEFGQVQVSGAGPGDGASDSITVNRSLISLGENRILVYYWFQGRGRIVTNEYLAKWFIFWDAITRNRTDGALVRVTTPVKELTDVESADRRLAEFIRLAAPRLAYYIPGESPVEERGE